MPSTAIGRIVYHPADCEMDVTFVGSARTYTYIGVEPHVHEEFARSFSKGQFFNARIRDRYPFRRWGVTDPSPRSPERGHARQARH